MAGFVAVHCGAGFHSKENDLQYKSLCKLACTAALEAFKISENPLDAINAAIITLEDNPLTNAGFGSNLTWDGKVECDACVMDGTTMNFGACGAVSCIKNPISLASQICLKQSDNMALGRIPPCMLVGSGAEQWATAAGIPHIPNTSLVSTKSQEKYKKNHDKIKKLERSTGTKLGPLDTVGAIFVGEDGRTAAGCSSGGIALKHSGRIGQAATFGCGCWAQNIDKVSIASSTSGCGEHLIKTMLAKYLANDIKKGDCPMKSLETSITKRFLRASVMQNEEEKLAGAICLKYDPIVGKGEVVWGYTTKSMCIGYADSYHNEFSFEAVLSRKPDEQPLMICGSSFQLRENLEILLSTKNKKKVDCIEVTIPENIGINFDSLNKDAKNHKKLHKIYDRKEYSRKRKAERKERHLSPSMRTENVNELSIERQIGNVVELGMLSPKLKTKMKQNPSNHNVVDQCIASIPSKTNTQCSLSTFSLPEVFKGADVLEVLDDLKHKIVKDT